MKYLRKLKKSLKVKLMIINSIELEGFMRFKDKVSIDFKDGIGVIYGNNGSGKTSIFDAVCMALYGKSYRTSGNSDNGFLNIGNLVNKNIKTSKIVLNFSSEHKSYIIEKNIHKSGKTTTYLFENGEQIAEGKNVHNLVVNKLIGMDYVSFKNSLFIAQNEAMSLLDSTGSERKNILRSLLKLDLYDKLLDVSNQLKKEYENKLSKLEGELNILKSNIKDGESIKQDINNTKIELEESKQKRKDTNKISILDEEISKIEKEIDVYNDEYKNMTAKLESLKVLTDKLNKDIKDLNERLSKVNGVSICPYCFSKITDPKYLYEHYENEINERKKEKDEKNKESDRLYKEINEINIKLNVANDKLKDKINKKNKEEQDFSNILTELETKIKDYEKEFNKINIYKKEMMEKEKEMSKINDKLLAIELLKEAYREVPNIIIRRVAPFIEKESGEIVNFISNGIIEDIIIDRDTFKIKPVVNGVAEELQFLSGGEKLRVGIALRLSISKMMVMASTGTIIKNLFIDEGDFGALDENGLNDIASLFIKLKEKFNKIIFITHIEDLKNKIADYGYNIIKTGNYVSSITETSNG